MIDIKFDYECKYWDYPRSGSCHINGKRYWFDEVEEDWFLTGEIDIFLVKNEPEIEIGPMWIRKSDGSLTILIKTGDAETEHYVPTTEDEFNEVVRQHPDYGLEEERLFEHMAMFGMWELSEEEWNIRDERNDEFVKTVGRSRKYVDGKSIRDKNWKGPKPGWESFYEKYKDTQEVYYTPDRDPDRVFVWYEDSSWEEVEW